MKSTLLQIVFAAAMLVVGFGIGLGIDWWDHEKRIADYRWSMKKAGVGDWQTNAEGKSKFIIHEKFRRH